MSRRRRLASVAGLSFVAWLVGTTAPAADFTRDGTIVLTPGQLGITSDGTHPGEPVLQFKQHCQPGRGQQRPPGHLHDRVMVRDRPQVLAQPGDSRDIDLTGDRHQRRNRQREGSNH